MFQYLRHLESGLFAGFLTALLAAKVETVFVASGEALGAASFLNAFGLSAFTLMPVMLSAGLIAGAVVSLVISRETLLNFIRRRLAKPEAPLRILAWGLPLLIVFIVFGLFHDRITRIFVQDFKNKDLSGWLLNLVEYCMLFAAPFAVLAIHRVLFFPLSKLNESLGCVLSHNLCGGVYALLVLGGFLAWILHLVLRVIEPFKGNERTSITALILLGLTLLIFLAGTLLLESWEKGRIYKVLSRIAPPPIILFILIMGGHFGRDPLAKAALDKRGPLYQTISPYYIRIADADGDQFGALMGGADKSPFDPWVYPGAPEIPGNGKDDNCVMGDAPEGFNPPKNPGFVGIPARWKNRKFNILFITLDAVRSDHLSCYGYKRLTSPNIDRLAADGVLFKRSYSNGTGTILSIPSFFSGKYMSQLQCHNLGSDASIRVLYPDTYTMPDYLREKGFMTVAVGAHGYLEFVNEQGGWDIFSNPKNKRVGPKGISSKEVTERAIDFAGKYLPLYKTFMWVHYYDPHDQYVPHRDGKSFGRGTENLYDGEIHYTDHHLGRLLESWSGLSPLPTVIIISSDHGESLGEHGIQYHNLNFYEPIVGVPLIFHLPGEKEGHVAHDPVALIDIFPTLRNLLGDEPMEDHFGRSLCGEIFYRAGNPDRKIYHEAQFIQFKRFWAKRGITTKDNLFVWDLLSGSEELYDKRSDPKELRNLITSEPELAAKLRGDLHEKMEAVGVDTPRANYCNYRRPVGGSRFYPRAAPELVEPYILNNLPEKIGKRVLVRFGEDNFDLIGLTVDPVTVAEKRKVSVDLYFKSMKRLEKNYKIFVHLQGKKGKWRSYKKGYDHWPAQNLLPTHEWPEGGIIVDSFEFNIPRGWGDGELKLLFGFYMPGSRKRLPVKVLEGGLKAVDGRISIASIRTAADEIIAEKISDIFVADGASENAEASEDNGQYLR